MQSSIEAGGIPVNIYSVVDFDSGISTGSDGDFGHHFSWDVYHIENYLLNPTFIKSALDTLNICDERVSSEASIEECLKRIARQQMDRLVSHKIRAAIGSQLVSSIDLGSDPRSADVAGELHKAVKRSVKRVQESYETDFGIDTIQSIVDERRKTLAESLDSGEWRSQFRGRDILRMFCGKYVQGMQYRYFRDLIISQMASANYQPPGMRAILDQILDD